LSGWPASLGLPQVVATPWELHESLVALHALTNLVPPSPALVRLLLSERTSDPSGGECTDAPAEEPTEEPAEAPADVPSRLARYGEQAPPFRTTGGPLVAVVPLILLST
jgi:hypothetical protein